MSDKRRFFSGATLEQAVSQAARHYGLEPRELAYREREKRHGFLKRRRGVVVEVDPSAPRSEAPVAMNDEVSAPATPAPVAMSDEASAPAAPAPSEESWSEAAPVVESASELEGSSGALGAELLSEEWWQGDEDEGAEPAARVAVSAEERGGVPGGADPGEALPAATGPLAESAARALALLLDLVGIEAEAKICQGEDRLEIELSGRDEGVLVERGGEVLLAVEHLLPRAIRGLGGTGIACRVDCGGFHARRLDRLSGLADRKAGEVRRSRRRRTLPPMSPEERRIVHMTLAEDRGVRTESRGEGYFKRVTIFPG